MILNNYFVASNVVKSIDLHDVLLKYHLHIWVGFDWDDRYSGCCSSIIRNQKLVLLSKLLIFEKNSLDNLSTNTVIFVCNPYHNKLNKW